MLKKLMIPVAAFAVTVSSVAAFNNTDWSSLDIDLTDNQISALEEAEEIRQVANEEAEEVLEAAGLNAEKMQEIHEARHEAHKAEHEAIKEAITNHDYEAFTTAIANSPLADQITSEADFEKLVEAHELMEAGDSEKAKEIFTELGIERGEDRGMGHHGFGGPDHKGDRQSAETE